MNRHLITDVQVAEQRKLKVLGNLFDDLNDEKNFCIQLFKQMSIKMFH